ncbi:tethering complex subunit [Tilletia horrida]|uniref:Tethering complex subunit n=1 Tax=Tilletia horrida TaxID=155126 RepID=A0AAN6G880_9BASI|nr:tethering complex subunit [Tilletia horrida]
MFDEFVQSSRTDARTAPRTNGSAASPRKQPPANTAAPVRDEEATEPVTALESGFVSNEVEESSATAAPIFQLGRVQYAFPAPLALMTVASNTLTMCLYARLGAGAGAPSGSATSTPKLVRIQLDDPERTEEAEVPAVPPARNRNAPPPNPAQQGPHKMFADPSGRHLILTMLSGDNFYWRSGWKKARSLPRLKGLVLESVAWNRSTAAAQSFTSKRDGTQMISTREILLGTRSGDVYEVILTAPLNGGPEEGDFLDRLARRTAGGGGSSEIDRSCRHVYTLAERERIVGLEAVQLPSGGGAGGASKDKARKAVVIAATPTRIFEFAGICGSGRGEDSDGDFVYDRLFEPYRSNSMTPNLKSELPGDSPNAQLHISIGSQGRIPKALAWMTDPGIYYGSLSLPTQSSGDSLIDSANLLPYPALNSSEGDGLQKPVSMALTDFHFLLLYKDQVVGSSILDDQTVYRESLPLKAQEHVLGTAIDAARRTYWVYTDSSIFEIIVKDEDRDVWKVYMQRGAFDQALKHSKSASQRDKILAAQGDRNFEEGKFIPAAQCYAQTLSRTFEEVILKFIDSDERDALRYYLIARLERLKKTDLTQRVMLATWLVEIYLSKINQLEDMATARAASDAANFRLEKEMLEDELRQFLVTYKDNLDEKTTFSLLSRHGRTDMYLYFAATIGQHERIVRHWIQEEDWTAALKATAAQSSPELYYQFAMVLMSCAPQECVDHWIDLPDLEPRKLMPAMLQARKDSTARAEAIRYLRHIVDYQRSTDSAVHNFLLTLLATAASEESSTTASSGRSDAAQALLDFIAQSEQDPITGQPYYDLDYALRTCVANECQQACVQIYAKMGLYESAVDLALDHGDIELASRCADMVEADEVLKKKLWLKSAKHVVQKTKDIKRVMTFLSNTDILSIEDILPFFPDFVVIDEFKDEICAALESYASRTEALKEEMTQATKSAEAIQADIAKLSERFITVEPTESCNLCSLPLLTRQFYVFHCRHSFHADCLIAETTRTLPPRSLRRIVELQNQLSSLTDGLVPAIPSTYGSAVVRNVLKPGQQLVGKGTAVAMAGLTGVTTGLGLDRLREFIVPDAVVSAISAGVSLGVAGGKQILAPLDPFEEPLVGSQAKAAFLQQKNGAGALNGLGPDGADAATGGAGGNRRAALRARAGGEKGLILNAEDEERVEEIRDELDSLVAKGCVLCDGAAAAIGRPLVQEAEAREVDWAI